MLCVSAKDNQYENCQISDVNGHKAELWSVDHWFITSNECLEILADSYNIPKSLAYFPWKGSSKAQLHMYIIKDTYLAYVLFTCLFFKPEAVSKHSVSLWIVYSVPINFIDSMAS